MTEDFLHYLWKFQNFDKKTLLATNGEAITLLNSGFHNHHAGPDFGDAKVMIGTQLWAGNIEIHIASSDWRKHKHQHDAAYNNVILHVVYMHDEEIVNEKGNMLPTIELKGRFDEYLYWRYEQLVQNTGFIPCEQQVKQVDAVQKEIMLERVLIERIARKSEQLSAILIKNNNDWEETAYQWLSYGFGIKINADPMLWLARRLPLKYLQKHQDEPLAVEALLLGTAGLLSGNEEDEQLKKWREQHQFYAQKYTLEPLEKSIWKYGRLRPVSFPEVRIGQWAAIVSANQHLFRSIIETGDLKTLKRLFVHTPNPYFNTHYRLGKMVKEHNATASEAFAERLIINVVIPFLFTYAQQKQEPFYQQRALDLLDQLPAESNAIVNHFATLGFSLNSAFHSQSLLELKSSYCNFKKCLTCTIGNTLLKE